LDRPSPASCTTSAATSAQGDGRLGVDLDDRDHSDLLLQLRGQPVQGLVELAVGQDAGTQPENVVAQVTDDPVQLLHGSTDAALQVRVAGQQGWDCL
jgi:hypothetical protein